ncbi:type II secretion system F family protein [Zavarzinia sp.]|uniref:type II secretion system F family protein n=1 Tax=Zavarzinia sp. TaxID=2027920 RepID=UPI003568BF65
MATFRYRAVVPATGEIRRGDTRAADRRGAIEALRAAGLVVIEAEEAVAAAPARLRRSARLRRALPDALGQLAALLDAGLTLDRALALLAESCEEPGLGAAFLALRERVKAGTSVAAAMAEAKGVFPPAAVALAEAGESAGALGPALGRLAEGLAREEELRRTLTSALFYPALLLVVAGGVVLLMLLVVVPQFEDLFADLGGDLPVMTRMVVAASHLLRDFGPVALVLAIAGVVLLRRRLARPEARAAIDARLLRLPVLGRLIAVAETARFARSLGTLAESGVALPAALRIAGRVMANSAMAAKVEAVATGLGEGAGLAGPLAAAGIFPPLAIGFIKTGEETARLGPMLLRLADVLERETRASTTRALSLLTPVVTIVLGVVVALVIAALMSAVLGINDLALQ